MRDLVERYDELYDDMATAKDPKKMMKYMTGKRNKR